MKKIIFIILAFISWTSFAGAGKIGNGGDELALRFFKNALEMHQLMFQIGQDQFAGVNLSKLYDAIVSTAVNSKKSLRRKGEEVEAMNWPKKRQIMLSRELLSNANDEKLMNLALHEYLGIMEIEENHYNISSSYLKIIQQKNLTLSGVDIRYCQFTSKFKIYDRGELMIIRVKKINRGVLEANQRLYELLDFKQGIDEVKDLKNSKVDWTALMNGAINKIDPFIHVRVELSSNRKLRSVEFFSYDKRFNTNSMMTLHKEGYSGDNQVIGVGIPYDLDIVRNHVLTGEISTDVRCQTKLPALF